ncbi:MAG: hypothetical protein ACUVWN_09615 [bacterium]
MNGEIYQMVLEVRMYYWVGYVILARSRYPEEGYGFPLSRE